MRNTHGIMVLVFAASLSAGANAQNVDWQIFTEPFVTSAHAADVDWQTGVYVDIAAISEA